MESEMKTVTQLVDELVEITYELEKVKFNTPQRSSGYVVATYIMSYGLDFGLDDLQIAKKLQNEIDQKTQELSDLSDKVEA